MSAPNIFPIYISPEWSERLWTSVRTRKPEWQGLTWYEAEVTVESATKVRTAIFGMQDNFYGGRGKCIGEFDITDQLTPDNWAYLRKRIKEAQLAWAEGVLEHRERQVRDLEVERIRMELFGEAA